MSDTKTRHRPGRNFYVTGIFLCGARETSTDVRSRFHSDVTCAACEAKLHRIIGNKDRANRRVDLIRKWARGS